MMRALTGIAGLLAGLALCAAPAAAVPNPTVEGPLPSAPVGDPSHDYPFGSALQDLHTHDYLEREYFVSGTTSGGRYKTRVVVRRPADAAKFSGNVLVEWQNVTNGFDADILWWRSGEQLMRDGDAFVAVSAQTGGLEDAATGLKEFNPKRYGSLHIDTQGTFVAEDAGYGIYGQALQALRHPNGVDLLGGLEPKQLIATGYSQSAGTVSIYASSFGIADGLADGYLIGGLSTSTLSSTGPASTAFPYPITALGVPVLLINTETDASFHRPPDTDTFRLWEVAGTSHADHDNIAYANGVLKRDFGQTYDVGRCDKQPGSLIPFTHAQDAAIVALEHWIATGQAPASQPQMQYDSGGQIVRDADGNALGGIRMPEQDVPTATNSRENTGATCNPFVGSMTPFAGAKLHELYPSHAGYVSKVRQAVHRALAAGVLLPADAEETVSSARRADIPPGSRSGVCHRRRSATIRIPRSVRRIRVVSARLRLPGGRTMRVPNGRWRQRIPLRHSVGHAIRVRLVLRLANGSVTTRRLVLRTCLRRA